MSARKQHAACLCGTARRKPWDVACPACWELIPADLKELVWHCFHHKRGSGEHIAAVRQCHEIIRANIQPKLI